MQDKHFTATEPQELQILVEVVEVVQEMVQALVQALEVMEVQEEGQETTNQGQTLSEQELLVKGIMAVKVVEILM